MGFIYMDRSHKHTHTHVCTVRYLYKQTDLVFYDTHD